LGLVLGLAARSEIRKSSGRLAGGRMAATAAVLGALNLVLSGAALAAGIHYWTRAPSATVAPAASLIPDPPDGDLSAPVYLPPRHYTEDSAVRSVQIGKVTLIDVGPEVSSLREELTKQQRLAHAGQAEMLVWVVAPRCGPCNGVSAALADPLMQKALRDARLVRIDSSRFAPELADLGIPFDVIPGFALLNPQNRPLDYIHGGEWDEDIAPNIAPVLGEFVRGTLKARREPWRGIKRRDETAL
jgi:hypothetical protein